MSSVLRCFLVQYSHGRPQKHGAIPTLTLNGIVVDEMLQVLLVQQPQDGSESQTGEAKPNSEIIANSQESTTTDLHIGKYLWQKSLHFNWLDDNYFSGT